MSFRVDESSAKDAMHLDEASGRTENAQRLAVPRINLLGVGISAVHLPQVLQAIDTWVGDRDRTYICLAAIHSLLACQKDPTLRRAFNQSGLTTPDGMPLVWLARAHGYGHVDRVYSTDVLVAVCQHGLSRGYRHFLYGGVPGVTETLAERLAERAPGLRVVGTYTPPFRDLSAQEVDEVTRLINGAAPDIVWVGIGTGKQERWMADFRPRLEAPVLISVGAAFDFLSGRRPQAPRWIQRSGLEWLFRLLSEPRRLWPRYREYPWFFVLLTAQILGLKRFPTDG